MEDTTIQSNQEEAYFGLPAEVKFCQKCVMSNQKPNAAVENKHTSKTRKETIHFDEDGICDACKYFDWKRSTINWQEREAQLMKLCNQYRSNDGSYDCIVPGSGGKDSCFAAHILKHKFNMHPLTVTWSPHLYTDIGWQGLQNWIEQGNDNFLVSPSGKTHRLLTRLAFKNLLHPFQAFMLGQKYIAPKLAMKFKIPLVFFGDNSAEYGMKKEENLSSKMDLKFFSYDTPTLELGNIFLGGVSVDNLIKNHNLTLKDLQLFLPSKKSSLEAAGVEVHFLSYYFNWDPQENYYYAAEHCNFKANPTRRDGTYCKYSSVDDKIDDLQFYTTFIKFGIGKSTYDAAQEIRCNKITREEGVALVKKFDGEFPITHHKEILKYLDMTEEEFKSTIDKFRSPHLWKKEDGKWILKHAVWHDQNKGIITEGSGQHLRDQDSIGYLKESKLKESKTEPPTNQQN